jgi:hypothetical protein
MDYGLTEGEIAAIELLAAGATAGRTGRSTASKT